MSVDKKMIKDDLYEAVNGDWIKNAKIPDDKPATGGFNDLVDKIDKQMIDDFDAYAEGKQKSDDARFNEMIKLYKIAKKFDFRKKVGPKALKRVLSSVEELKSYDDYQAQWRNWIMYGLPSPVTFDIDANGILKVSARDMDTGKEQSITITANDRMSEEEIRQAMADAQNYAGQDQIRREAMEVLNDSQNLLARTEQAVKNAGKLLDKNVKKQVKADISRLRKLVMKCRLDRVTEADVEEMRNARAQLESSAAQIG